ncbi:MarR family transcriptional regulator [Pseudooceanicola spongiae]|uniref:MarR family transcriptional regulator n=2 Tax=Pseudooceanicola spongiae TaxID=2613965 RepID=A0A7L9WKM2_9RHOB|nr:MarR family transcriptional regulator [Pseudooceanicola spongiae]
MQNTAMREDASAPSRPDGGFTAPEGCRLIARADWERQRWDWLEGVRRDGGPGGLSPTARLLAHALVLDFANHRTARCDPTIAEIASAMGTSAATVKRALADLEAGRWIVRDSGRGKGRHSRYGFLTRAKVVPLQRLRTEPSKGCSDAPAKGCRNDPSKGVMNEPSPTTKRGQICSVDGSDMSHPYNKDKPYKNHKGREGAHQRSQNPMVCKRAEDAVRSFRGGRSEAFAELPGYVLNHIIAADLLTPDERQTSGIF